MKNKTDYLLFLFVFHNFQFNLCTEEGNIRFIYTKSQLQTHHFAVDQNLVGRGKSNQNNSFSKWKNGNVLNTLPIVSFNISQNVITFQVSCDLNERKHVKRNAKVKN